MRLLETLNIFTPNKKTYLLICFYSLVACLAYYSNSNFHELNFHVRKNNIKMNPMKQK